MPIGVSNREQLSKDLREALTHLRDPGHMRRSPLVDTFGLEKGPDAPAALRRILVEGVKALKPDPGEPSHSPAWRRYEALYYRYVQYFSQLEVADQLGISTRQLRREEHDAFDALADLLASKLVVASGDVASAPEPQASDMLQATGEPTDNLAWLRETHDEPTDLHELVLAVVALMRPLGARHRVELDVEIKAALPPVSGHPVAIRQILLNLLGVALPRASACGVLSLRAAPTTTGVEVSLRCERTAPRQPLSADDAARLDMAARLATICSGMLVVDVTDEVFTASLTFEAVGQWGVLVVDDTPGAISLLQRFAAGTRYRVHGIRDPQSVVDAAVELAPRVIVLDVMMPQVDGWELLGRLRLHPATGDIPVIVYTVLAQEELALSLGASDFLRKPVTRQAFLAALERQASRQGQEPR